MEKINQLLFFNMPVKGGDLDFFPSAVFVETVNFLYSINLA